MIELSYLTIDGTLTGTTNLNQSGTGSNANERVLYIPQSSVGIYNFMSGIINSGDCYGVNNIEIFIQTHYEREWTKIHLLTSEQNKKEKETNEWRNRKRCVRNMILKINQQKLPSTFSLIIQKNEKCIIIGVKSCKLPPLILSRKENIFLGPEVNRRPYLFMWECDDNSWVKKRLYVCWVL